MRLGKVALHWQEAHPCGVPRGGVGGRPHLAHGATVRDGREGRETVRMDEPGVRHIRVQGEKRATRYGYSLWSVEAYAVAR
ncbi:hypothetical protein GCM10023238_01490 [Streptomyces heliomycini]